MNRFICCLAVLLLASCARIDLHDELAKQSADAWLTRISDDRLLLELSIPGAHDAATSTINTLTLFTRTQELNVAELWNCGVRAFDLRPAWKDGTLGIYHDRYDANVSFQHIMNMLQIALKRDPGEFAIVLVRHEQEADGNDPDWAEMMGAYLGSSADNLVPYTPGLTVGEMRGKILVLSRNEYAGGPYGGYIRGWNSGKDIAAQKGASVISPASDLVFPLWVQDYYAPANADEKWEEVRDMLDAAAESRDALVINHASGYLGGSIPDYRSNAHAINSRIIDYLYTHASPAGIIMMDFAGVPVSKGIPVYGKALVEALTEQNQK